MNPMHMRTLSLPILSVVLLAGCPGTTTGDDDDDDSFPADDDSTAGDDDTTGGDDDSTPPGDDDSTPVGDDDSAQNCVNISGSFDVAPSLTVPTPIPRIEMFVFAANALDDQGYPVTKTPQAFDATVVENAASLPVAWNLCAGEGSFQYLLFMDANGDLNPCSEGDFHGYGDLIIPAAGLVDLTLLLNEIVPAGACGGH